MKETKIMGKKYETLKSIYFKKWLFLVCVVTIIFLIIGMWPTNAIPLEYFDLKNKELLRKLTPSHPPPLVNFME